MQQKKEIYIFVHHFFKPALILILETAKEFYFNNVLMFFYVLFSYRTPLNYAIRKMNLQTIRLLLDYKADPNYLYNGKSMLSYAAQTGNFQAIKMLIDAGADTHRGSPQPLETIMKFGSRECLAALLDGHMNDLLVPINGHLPIEIALEAETTLLSVIAVFTKREIDKAKKEGTQSKVPEFPPKNMKRSKVKKLNAALKQNDYLLPVDVVRRSIMNIKSPWKTKDELEKKQNSDEVESIERSLAESMNMSKNAAMSRKIAAMASEYGNMGDGSINYQVPPTPFRLNGNEDDEDEDDINSRTRSPNRSLVRLPNDSDSGPEYEMRYHLASPKTP